MNPVALGTSRERPRTRADRRGRAVITDWTQLPLVMHAEHVAQLLDREVGGVKKAAQRGTLPGPPPFSKYPWSWYREDWRAHFEGRRARRVA